MSGHTGAKLPGHHEGLEGEGETGVMRFVDREDVMTRADELTAVLRAWCDWKVDASKR